MASKSGTKTVGAVCAAGMICVFAALAWVETMSISVAEFEPVAGWRVSNMARLVCSVAVACGAHRLERAFALLRFAPACAAVFAAGSFLGCLSLLAAGAPALLLFVVAICALAVASTLSLIRWLLLCSRLESGVFRTLMPCVLAGSVISFAISYNVDALAALVGAFVFGAASSVLLVYACQKENKLQPKSVGTPTHVRARVIWGVVVLAFAGRLGEILTPPASGMELVCGIVSIGVATAVFAVLFVRHSAQCYESAVHVIVTLFVASYIMTAMGWLQGSFTTLLAYTAGRLLLFVVIAASVELASCDQGSALRILACSCILQSVGGVLDFAAGSDAFAAFAPASAAIIGIVLSFAVIWLLNDRSVDLTFVGGFSDKPAQGASEEYLQRAAQRFGFTPKEKEICALLMEGRSIPFAAEALFVSENTVKSHVSRMYAKVGVHTRQEFISAIRGQ